MHTQGDSAYLPTRDGRTLHAAVLPGPEDGPVVVFEAGAAASRSSWAAVQPPVAEFATAVAYDRSGLGRSAPDPVGRTLDRMADDLNDLLDGIGADRRFVLVGHSAGGPIVRLAASRRRARIVGLVLVDPTDEAADMLFGRGFRAAERVMIAVGGVLARLGLFARMYAHQFKDAPDDVKADAAAEAFTPGVLATYGRQARTFLGELETWRTTPPELGDIPVTVISGANTGDGMTSAQRDAANASHAVRAAAHANGRHVFAENSGHLVPLTDPELIVEEIRRLVTGPSADGR